MRYACVVALALVFAPSPGRALPVLDQAFGAGPATPAGGSVTYLTSTEYDHLPPGDLTRPAVDQAQTFTVGVSGSLTRAGMWLGACCTDPAIQLVPLEVQLRRTVGGVPGTAPSDILASVFLSQADIQSVEVPEPGPYGVGWLEWSFPSAPTVAAGDALALVLVHYPLPDPSFDLYDTGAYRARGDEVLTGSASPTYDRGQEFYLPSTLGTWQSQDGPSDHFDIFFATWVDVPEPGAASAVTLALALFASLRARRRQ